jgi:hypothetical protein
MKKLIGIVIILIGLNTSAQCRGFYTEGNIFLTPHYGTTGVLGADVSVRIDKIRVGVGASVLVDNTLKQQQGVFYKEFQWSVYSTVGIRLQDFYIASQIGIIKNNPNETVVNLTQPQLPNTTSTLYGGSIGYFVKSNISVNVGWNNLSEYNIGISFGFH